MNRSALRSIFVLAAAAAMLSACGASSSPTTAPPPAAVVTPAASVAEPPTATPAPGPASIALTIENGACTYDGPTSIPYGPYAVTFDVRDTTYPENGWFVFTLEPGRTVEEARAAFESGDDSEQSPPWLTILTVHPFGGTPGTAETWQENLREMGAYRDGPIYILCARPDHVYDIFGPIEVVQ